MAIIEPVSAHGGMDYYDMSLCRSLKNAGIEPILYTSSSPHLAADYFRIETTFDGVFSTSFRLLKVTRWLRGLLASLNDAKQSGATIVHFHLFDSGPIQLSSVWLASLHGFKVVATIHDIRSFHYNRSILFSRNVLSRFDGVIVHNDTSMRELVRDIGLSDTKLTKIPHGNYAAFIGEPVQQVLAREKLGIGKNCKLLLFFGQVKKVKGLNLAIEAIALMEKSGHDVKLLVAGKCWKDDISTYRERARKLGVDDKIIWHNHYIPNEMVDQYFYASDVVLLPYNRIYQSGVLLLAMSYGKPVVASDIEGMREHIDDCQNGLIFISGHSESLATRILELFEDADLADRVGAEAKRYVTEHHDWDDIGRKTAEFYESIIHTSGVLSTEV